MTEPRPSYARLKALFEAVADLPADADRHAALMAAGAAPSEAAEVLELLSVDARSTVIGAPVAALAATLMAPRDPGPGVAMGDRLGPWRLLRVLGEGGMGRVFLAERDDGHYQQQVAVKLLNRAMAAGPGAALALDHLRRERQILAGLQHPGIARLIDGGSTPQGQPYLVMERVEGERIDQWCQVRGLDLAARLALLGQVCEAVAHAHRQLVIHCDIKPSNVLVDADGRPHLLDFGVSRLLHQPDAALLGLTPGYAAPEQLAGQVPGVPADVYALGRLLQVLSAPLAGRHRRGRELQAIIDRACATLPEERYGSADALQQDLRRLLAHRPLAALQGQPLYALRKALRRHWPWVLAGLAGLALAGGFTLRLVAERDRALAAEAQAQAERRRAESEVQTTAEVSRFLMSLFTGADPRTTGVPDPPKALMLDAGRARLATELAERGALRARLLVVLGDVYERIDRVDDAISAFDEAARLFARDDIAQPLAQADALRRLALTLANNGEAMRAEAPARMALALRRQHAPQDEQALADALNRLGVVLTALRRFDEAQPLLQQALALRERGGRDTEALANIASTRHNLARLLRLRGQPERAVALWRQVLAEGQLPDTDARRLGWLEGLGLTLSQLQQHEESLDVLRRAVDGWTQAFGPDNGNVAVARAMLGRALARAGRSQQAQAEWQAVLDMAAARQQTGGLRLAHVHADLATLAAETGRPAVARAAWVQAMQLLGATPNVAEVAQAQFWEGQARSLALEGRRAEALTLAQRARALREQRLSAGDPDRLSGELLEAALVLDAESPAGPAMQAATTALPSVGARLAPDAPRALRLEWQRLQAVWAVHRACGSGPGPRTGSAGGPGGSSDACALAALALQQAWQAERDWRGVDHPALLPGGLQAVQALRQAGQWAAAQALHGRLAAVAQAHDPASRWRHAWQAAAAARPPA